MKSLLLIGAGGHGEVVADLAEECGYVNIVFLDDNADSGSHWPVVGGTEDVESH